jgi:hypothetical protein
MHAHVALRFLPQASYARAAPMEIVPMPDVVTRVFMIFKGIPEVELPDWSSAAARAREDVALWKQVIRVEEKQMGKDLFRVLEWGGAEVL